MTEYFRIEGLNDILFDQCLADEEYCIPENLPWRGLSTVLTRAEVLLELPNLPKEIRSHALNRGLSVIRGLCTIGGETDALMEQNEHLLNETLVDAALYIETEGARGTQAVLRVKTDQAVDNSYKTIFYGKVDELDARDILGAKIKEHELRAVRITLYCEPHWRPSTAITLGPNEIYCPSFEEDGDGNGRADDWTAINVPTLTMEGTIVLHGCYSQKVVTRAVIGDGIQSAITVAPAGVTSGVCYAWIARPAAAPSDIIVELYDSTGPLLQGSALYDTAGWPTALGKDGVTTFYRVAVPVAAGIVPGNNHVMRIFNTQDTETTFYVDKCYWLWDTVTIPDEWCDHWLAYNHYDTTEGAAHEGHINYYDTDDLKGDVDARLLMRVEYEKIAEAAPALDLIVARRTREDYCSFLWWLEAEDADVQTLWADLGGLALASAGDCVSNGANPAGHISWTTGAVAGFDLPANWGKFDVYGAVYTDDEVNTQYRLSYVPFFGGALYYNNWVKQTQASVWELIYLGEVAADIFTRDGQIFWRLAIRLDYEKDAADTVRADFIWLLPKDEPEMLLYHPEDGLTVADYWAITRAEDFDYQAQERGAVTVSALWLQGDAMTLAPRLENRLYFVCISPTRPHYEAHRIGGPANALEMIVSIDYLPQFITPLE